MTTSVHHAQCMFLANVSSLNLPLKLLAQSFPESKKKSTLLEFQIYSVSYKVISPWVHSRSGPAVTYTNQRTINQTNKQRDRQTEERTAQSRSTESDAGNINQIFGFFDSFSSSSLSYVVCVKSLVFRESRNNFLDWKTATESPQNELIITSITEENNEKRKVEAKMQENILALRMGTASGRGAINIHFGDKTFNSPIVPAENSLATTPEASREAVATPIVLLGAWVDAGANRRAIPFLLSFAKWAAFTERIKKPNGRNERTKRCCRN